jgi:predicted 2-oxoglutarate/Fe(II)-dependent dioxygenase YbiX
MDKIKSALLADGRRVPACYGMTSDRSFYSFNEQYGRCTVLLLVGADATDQLPAMLRAFGPSLDHLAGRDTDVLLILQDDPAAQLGDALALLPIRAIGCGTFLSRCGLGPHETGVLVLDRNLRTALWRCPASEPSVVTACLACLDALPNEPARDVLAPAPVIVLPNLFPRALCQTLIGLFESSPTIEGEIACVSAAGVASNVVDHAKKRRRDMIIAEGTGLHRILRDMLLDRCRPEIAKAFQCDVRHTDRLLLSRYDVGGWFRKHRDNDSESVSFREFALSVNLNTGDYQGGRLMFPEYNDHRHEPPAGGGIIFSTSVLHEAAPVTQGSRYVLLTFFHGEAAETRRQAMMTNPKVHTLIADGHQSLPGR